MLSESQVAKARTFPGCNDLTADNAVDKLFAAADSAIGDLGKAATSNVTLAAELKTAKEGATKLETDLATAKAAAPQATPPNVLKAMASASRIALKDAVSKQAITPAVSEALASSLIGTDEQLSAVGLTPSASGECVATMVFSALANNGAAPNVGKDAKGQAAPKTAAGAPTDQAISEDRLKALLESTPLGQAVLAK